MDDGTFASYLFLVRQRNGLTQIDLAKRSGLSARCISDLERGINAAPRLSTIEKLSSGLDLSVKQRQELLEVAAHSRLRLRQERLAARRA